MTEEDQAKQIAKDSQYVAQIIGDGTAIVSAAPLQPTPAVAPAPPPHFTGRRPHLDALKAALGAGGATLLTALQGMGGIGKTATALKLAQEVADAYPGGVFWADLPRHAGDPRPVLRDWARCCAHDLGAEPDLNVLANQVRGLLAARRDERGPLLALVDDVRERWLAAAQLLQRALPPGVPLLLTTRDERLADALGAQVRRLDALPPDEALALLGRLAGQQVVQAEPAASTRLLAAVGHLPLAIELAGKRLLALARKPGATGLVAGLAQAVETRAAATLTLPGHPGLAATFAITYAALPEEARRHFRWLGVFAPGPLSPEHVAGVLELSQAEAQASLDALVPPALLAWGQVEGTYALHPLLRQYARQLLDEAGEAGAARERHLAHYMAYAEAHKQPTAAAYDALEAVRPDVLAAMDRACREERWSDVRRLAWALIIDGVSGYLPMRGYWAELRARLEQAVHAAQAEGHERDAAAFTHNWAVLAQDLGSYEQARELCGQSLVIFEELGNRACVASSLGQLGNLAYLMGDLAEARAA